MYPFTRVPFRPPGLVTVTLTGPTVPAGVDVVIELEVIVGLLAMTTPFTPTKVTVAFLAKPNPVMVTGVPPLKVPERGDTWFTTGLAEHLSLPMKLVQKVPTFGGVDSSLVHAVKYRVPVPDGNTQSNCCCCFTGS